MPPKSAKKKRSANLKKSLAKSRRRTGPTNDGAQVPLSPRQEFPDVLGGRHELLKQADAALHESQKQAAAKVAELESLLKVTPIPIWIARTPDCRHITGNQAAAELLGASLDTNVSQTPGEHPIEVPMVCCRAGQELASHELPMQRAAASGQPVRDEFEVMLPDGRVMCLCGQAIPLKDAAGTVTGVIAAFADITERKQAESVLLHARERLEQQVRERTAQLAELNAKLEQQLVESRMAETALRESEQRFSTFFDHAPNLAFVKGLDGRYLYVNRRFEEVFRLESGTVLGRTDRELFARDQADHFQVHDRQVLDSGQAQEFEERAWHGDDLRTSIVVKFPLRDEDGRVRAIGGVATDITERRRAVEELRRSESFINSVVEHLPSMIFIKSAQDLRFVRINKTCAGVLGYAKGELIGRNDYDFFPKDEADFFTAMDREVLATGRLLDIPQEPIRTRDGAIRYLHTKKIPIAGPDGSPQYLLGISEDITDRKRTEEELEKRAGLSDFFAEVSLSLNLNEPLDLLLQRCVETMAARLGSALARIWVLGAGDCCDTCSNRTWCNDHTQCLHLQASAGLSRNLHGEYCRVPLGMLKIGRIAQGAGAMVMNDILQDDRLPNKQWIKENGLQSFAGFPLVVEGRVFGVLALFGRETLSEATLQTVESVCYGVATSIARKRTEDRLRDNERALTRSREELRELTGQLLTAQDDERKRIARDLHDDYNQRLAAVAVDLQVLGKSIPAAMQEQITAIQKQVEALSDDIHDLAYHLHPSLLDDVGLEVALRDLVQTFGQREQIGVWVSFNQVPGQLPKAIATCVYRVAQESLRNVAKHGKASEAVVTLSGSRFGLGLSVRDTGKGFAPDQPAAPNHQGLGLKSMQERLRLVNGVFTVQSRPGYGTKVCAWIPFSEGGS